MSAAESLSLPECVKEELERENASETELYTEYEVKSELEYSPERIQPQDINVTIPESSKKIEMDLEIVKQEILEEIKEVPVSKDSPHSNYVNKQKPCLVKQEILEELKEELVVAVPAKDDLQINYPDKQKKWHAVSECTICNRSFKSAHSLKKHMAVHVTSPYTCKYCNKKLVLKRAFKNHKAVCRYASLCVPLYFQNND